MEWYDEILFQVHELQNMVYLQLFSYVLMKGSPVEQAKQSALKTTEEFFHLIPGSFVPTINSMDSSIF